MLYCEKCHRLTEGEACPACGRARSLRPPQADDPVLLCTVRSMSRQHDRAAAGRRRRCPFSKLALGSSALLGGSTLLENYAFYVPFAAYDGRAWSF